MRTRIRFRLPGAGREPEVSVQRRADGSLEIDVDASETTKTVHELTGWALDHGVALESLEITQPTLEDVYLQLTGAEVGT
jgi:ABC-2 type transport system ATP-binding protein